MDSFFLHGREIVWHKKHVLRLWAEKQLIQDFNYFKQGKNVYKDGATNYKVFLLQKHLSQIILYGSFIGNKTN